MAPLAATTLRTTPRLLLRTFRDDDLPVYAALNADPRVMEFLGGRPMSREGSDAMARWAQRLHAREGLGLLAVERRADGAFLGMCGLHRLDWWPDDVEVAWRLAPEHWGNGYATEAATAWLDHGFGALGLPRIVSITDPPHARSIAVMHRLGMVFEGTGEGEEDGERFPVVVHGLTARGWTDRATRPPCPCAP